MIINFLKKNKITILSGIIISMLITLLGGSNIFTTYNGPISTTLLGIWFIIMSVEYAFNLETNNKK